MVKRQTITTQIYSFPQLSVVFKRLVAHCFDFLAHNLFWFILTAHQDCFQIFYFRKKSGNPTVNHPPSTKQQTKLANTKQTK